MEQKRILGARKRIALVAHDNKKKRNHGLGGVQQNSAVKA